MPTYIFEEVKVKRVKKYKDENGKTKQVTRVFSQTLNPFNKKDGKIKNRMQIVEEITSEADKWMATSNTSKYGDFMTEYRTLKARKERG